MNKKKVLLLAIATWVAFGFILFFSREHGAPVALSEPIKLENGLLKDNIPQIALVNGWTTDIVNVWEEQSTASANIGAINFNENISYYKCSDGWIGISNDDYPQGYIESKYISDNKIDFVDISTPSNNGYKSYMSYKAISSPSSPQYRLQSNFAYTGKFGIRMIEGRYCIAVGTGFGVKVGTYLDLMLKNGTVIQCIVGDIKSDVHTLADNMTTAHNGCVAEFIVDMNYLNPKAKQMGNISACCSEWNSSLKTVRVYKKSIF